MVEGNMLTVKYLVFGFNLLFFLAGLGVMVCGACVETKFKEYFEFADNTNMSVVAIFLIVVGVVILVIGFFGCMGAYKENYCMVMTYAVLIGIVFLLQISAGIAAYLLRAKVQTLVKKNMHDTIPRYGTSGGVTRTWDAVQKHLKCCGLFSYDDWERNPNLAPNMSVPDSCCTTSVVACGHNKLKTTPPTGIHMNACLKKFEAFVKENIYVIGGVGVGLAFIQVAGFALACYLARGIKSEYEVMT